MKGMNVLNSLSLFVLIVFIAAGCSARQVQESETIAIFRSIAISPDGHYIAAGRDIFNIIFLYDSRSLEIVKYFRGQQEDIRGKFHAGSIDFSPDGKYLAAGGIDDIVCIWDIASGEKVRFLSELNKPNVVTFSPDGETLAVAGPDNAIRLVDVCTGKIKSTLTGPDGVVLSAAFSPAENILISGGTDNILRLWDLESGQQIATYQGHTAPVERITFSPDGGKLISASKSELKHWQISSQEARNEKFDTEGFDVKTNSLSLFVNLLGVINFAHSGLAFRPVSIKPHLQAPLSADFSSDGRFLALTVPDFSFSGNYQMRIHDLESKHTVQVTGQFFAIAVSPDGTFVATAGNGVKLWDLKSGKQMLREK